MDDLAYLGVIAFGALTLIVEATRQFSVPTKLQSHDNFPILRGLELASLSTRNEFIRGYIFYVLFYLVIYAAFLGSTELYNLLEAAARQVQTVGPTGSFQGTDETISFESGKYAKPLFISTTIIFALSIGIISKVEIWVRNFSHRLAGIPRGVYRVITQLNRVDYDQIARHVALPQLSRFKQVVAEQDASERNEEANREVRQYLRIIDILSPGLTGKISEQFWPQDSLNQFSALIVNQKEMNAQVEKAVEDFSEGKEPIEDLAEIAHECKNSALALFALLYIRNRNISIPNLHNASARVIIELRREKTDPIVQSIFGALLFSFFLSIMAYFFIEVSYSYLFTNDDANGYFAVVANDAGYVAQQALWFAIRFNVLFAIAAFLAASVRESNIEMGVWASWSSQITPYQRLIYSAILPSLFATMIYGLLFFLEYAVGPFITGGIIITSRHIADFASTHLPFILMSVFLPFFVSLCVYYVANYHIQLAWYKTAGISVLFAFACFIWSAFAVIVTYGTDLGGSDTSALIFSLKEAAVYFVSALIFFCAFAILVELTEGKPKSVA